MEVHIVAAHLKAIILTQVQVGLLQMAPTDLGHQVDHERETQKIFPQRIPPQTVDHFSITQTGRLQTCGLALSQENKLICGVIIYIILNLFLPSQRNMCALYNNPRKYVKIYKWHDTIFSNIYFPQ